MGETSLSEKRTFQFVCKYFLLASAVAFFGWLFETLSFVILWQPSDRGMLTLPFCYLYGAVALAVWFTLGTPFSGNMGKLYAKMKGEHPSCLRIAACAALMFVLYFTAGHAAFHPGRTDRRSHLYQGAGDAAVELQKLRPYFFGHRMSGFFPAVGSFDHIGDVYDLAPVHVCGTKAIPACARRFGNRSGVARSLRFYL